MGGKGFLFARAVLEVSYGWINVGDEIMENSV